MSKRTNHALGLVETMGYGVAISAADAALKSASVEIIKIEECIGSGGSLGVTLYITGDVSSVISAVDAGANEARKIGKVISTNVIPNLDNKVKAGMFKNSLEI